MDLQVDHRQLFGPFIGHEGGIISFVKLMQRHSLSPADVLRLYDRHVADMQAAMQQPPEDRPRPESPSREVEVGPCPQCGQTVFAVPMCRRISPVWRTQYACARMDCDFQGASRLELPALIAGWPAAVEAERHGA